MIPLVLPVCRVHRIGQFCMRQYFKLPFAHVLTFILCDIIAIYTIYNNEKSAFMRNIRLSKINFNLYPLSRFCNRVEWEWMLGFSTENVLGTGSDNEWRRYIVTSPLIGWTHTQNAPHGVVLCLFMVCNWKMYHYNSEWLHWHWDNGTIPPALGTYLFMGKILYIIPAQSDDVLITK